jgi:SPX domain protein involved in polyphosphate accumulation
LGGVASTLQLASYLKQVSKKQLEHAFGEFYRGLILLQNYATLNAQAAEKILKKHDKNIGLKTKELFMKETVIKFDFYKHSDLNTLISEVEVRFARYKC